MDWNVGGLGNHVTVCIKERTRVVTTFLNIRGECTPFERSSHFFGDCITAMTKHFELYGIHNGVFHGMIIVES
jgi:hypothetical protein